MQRGLTKKQRQFIELYRDKAGDILDIQRAMNISRARVYAYLQKENVKKEINSTIELTKAQIRDTAPLALVTLKKMMVNDDTPANVRANIAMDLLDRAGLTAPKEATTVVNVNTIISERAKSLLASRLEGITIDVGTVE